MSRLFSLLFLAAIFCSGCDSADPAGAAEVAGTYELVGLGSACDVMIAGTIREGGTFTPVRVEGTLTLAADGSVTHAFDIAGTCALPGGQNYVVDWEHADTGSYAPAGGRNVRIEHQGIECTGTYDGGTMTVRTGTLFPPVRLTFQLRQNV